MSEQEIKQIYGEDWVPIDVTYPPKPEGIDVRDRCLLPIYQVTVDFISYDNKRVYETRCAKWNGKQFIWCENGAYLTSSVTAWKFLSEPYNP